ncbi:MAG: inositol monophosphatase family protein, partial [Planctomycetota bacterium]
MTDPARMLEAAHEAVRLAAHVCRDVQRRLDDVRAITKDDDSPVTVADFASQAVVAHVLRERLGEIPLVAEETSAFLRDPDHRTQLGAALEAARISWPEATEQSLLDAIDLGDAEPDPEGGFWTLDPIDGTKGFLRGQQYAVALGFVRGREPVLAAMACPNLSRNHAASLETPDPVG